MGCQLEVEFIEYAFFREISLPHKNNSEILTDNQTFVDPVSDFLDLAIRIVPAAAESS
jgi:hypothetical protein